MNRSSRLTRRLWPLLLAPAALAAQNREHPGAIHLGGGRWGTRAEAEAAGLFEYHGRWFPKKLEPKLRAWEKQDAKVHGWDDAYDTSSKHYRIRTDAPRFVVELEIKPFLDALYDTYVKVFDQEFGLQAKAADNKFIQIYHGYATYKQQTGKTRGTPGFIVGSNVLHVFYEDIEPSTFYGTVYHEGAHQFFAAMLPGAQLPHWLNEALATYFEGCIYSRSSHKITVSLVPSVRLRFARNQLARVEVADPEKMFMAFGKEQYNALHYALGWSFVHYLTHVDGGKHRTAFGKLLRELNGSGAKPFAEVFRSVLRLDLVEFAKGWKPFIMSQRADDEVSWVTLNVGTAPEGCELRTGDQVVSVDGIDIHDTAQFGAVWAAVKQKATPVLVVALRRQGALERMDFEYEEVRCTVDPTKVSLRAGGSTTRTASLAD